MDLRLHWVCDYCVGFASTLSVGVAREAAVWAQGARVVDDRVKGGADVRIFKQSTDGHPDHVVDALIGCEGQGSKEAVFALGEPQGQRLQRLFSHVLHHCTMTENRL